MGARILASMEVRVISWNLFHGRDRAPDRSLHSWRSRLLRRTERGETHAQVNRDLYEEFAHLLEQATWDVALLQECPPRWAEALATRCRAEPHLILTSRNLPARLRRAQAALARLNPDLIASWEGGSNLTLVRSRTAAAPVIAERRELTMTHRPEIRRMAFTRLESGACIANLHASTAREAAESDVRLAAETAVGWADREPLIVGGDFNLRPSRSGPLFAELARRWQLQEPTGAEAIDHILARGAEIVDAPTAWEDERREVSDPTAGDGHARLPIRLSDHAPVEASFELAAR